MTFENSPLPILGNSVVVEDWPMGLDATRQQLKKAQKRLDRYRAALRLANTEIERRNRGIIALTTFAYQACRVSSVIALVKLALVQALETTMSPVGAIVLINPETKNLTLKIHQGLDSELARIVTGQQLKKGAEALMPHLVVGSGALLEYHTSQDKMERQLLETSGLTSLVSLPLQLGSTLMGALLVGLADKRTFKPAELCFLMAISQEVAIAMESLRLRDGLWDTAATFLGNEPSSIDLAEVDKSNIKVHIPTPFDIPTPNSTTPESAEDDLEQLLAAMMEAEDEVQQQNADLQTLNEISEMINRSLDLKAILQCAVDQTQATLKTDATWLYLTNETDSLDIHAHIGLSDNYIRGMQRLEFGDQIEGKAAAENKAYFITSLVKDAPRHKIWVDKEGLQSIAAVPITRPSHKQNQGTASEVIGILATARKNVESYIWSPREMRLLNSMTNQIALAIENAQLYAQVQENEVGLRTGNEVLRAINDMLLEKNTYLTGVIDDDLTPLLCDITPILQRLTSLKRDNMTETQKQDLSALQSIMSRLNSLTQETTAVDHVLDKAVTQTFTQTDEHSGSIKPLRLEKHQPAQTSLVINEVDAGEASTDEAFEVLNFGQDEVIENLTPLDVTPVNDEPSRPMSFAEAVSAGLVPAHILNRENGPSASN